MAEPQPDPPGKSGSASVPARPGVARALGRNIEAVARRRADDNARASGGVRLSTRIGRRVGTMGFVYANLAFYTAWLLGSVGALPGVPRFDAPLYLVGSVASVEAIFLAIIILITQNHEAAANDRRDDLNLQVSLLTEHELTRLIKLTIVIAEKLGIDPDVAGIADLQHDVHPDEVLDTIERAEGQ